MLKISSILLTILTAVYFTFGLNFVLFNKIKNVLETSDGLSLIFTATIPLFFVAAFTIIFTPFISKYIAKPFLVFLLITSGIINYAAHSFGVIFNQDMMVNIFETAPKEAASYLNFKLVIWIFLSGIVPSLLVIFTKIEYKPFLKELLSKAVLIIVSGAIILLIATFFYKDYASIMRNNPKLQKDIVPTYYLSSTYKYIKNRFFVAPLEYQEIGMDAERVTEEDDEKYLFVVLVGETARAQNYQLNGYARKTNAYTSKINNVISFKNVSSCGTATAVSLPCMFSMMGRSDYSRAHFDSQDNVIDIMKRAGYKQIWIDNNTGCKGVCKNIENYETVKMPALDCKGEECTDSVFLDVIDEQIKSLNGQDGIIYLHLLGSHGPTYFKRYPPEFAKFKPDCRTSDLQNCTKEEIVNAYDNTILFTDYVMSKVINGLDQYKDTYKTGVIYMSDHGESLGENGLYLHGMPYGFAPEEQTHIPFMVWLSDTMIEHEKMDMKCMKDTAQSGVFSHDNLSHTLLEVMDVKTTASDPKKDMWEHCEYKSEQ